MNQTLYRYIRDCLEQIYLLEQILEWIKWKNGMFKENWFTRTILTFHMVVGGGGGQGTVYNEPIH